MSDRLDLEVWVRDDADHMAVGGQDGCDANVPADVSDRLSWARAGLLERA